MEGSVELRPQQQHAVNAYFQAHVTYWKDVYAGSSVEAVIYRERYLAVLDWIDGLGLGPGSRVLEIGCGAGLLAVTLARRGLQVHAIDSAEAMVEQARRHARESGTTGLFSVDVGDVGGLAFAAETFDLVLAIGVIPWLAQPRRAIQEMARVTKPDGHVILTADNWPRLDHLLDPWLNPLISPLKRRVKAMVYWTGLRYRTFHDLEAHNHSRHYIDDAIARAGLVKARGKGLGFGPFSLFRRRIVPESLGVDLHRQLQYLADQNVPGIRSAGAHYIVLARKSKLPPAS